MRGCARSSRHDYFPCDDAANKLIWLVLSNVTADWSYPGRDWKEAMKQFAIL